MTAENRISETLKMSCLVCLKDQVSRLGKQEVPQVAEAVLVTLSEVANCLEKDIGLKSSSVEKVLLVTFKFPEIAEFWRGLFSTIFLEDDRKDDLPERLAKMFFNGKLYKIDGFRIDMIRDTQEIDFMIQGTSPYPNQNWCIFGKELGTELVLYAAAQEGDARYHVTYQKDQIFLTKHSKDDKEYEAQVLNIITNFAAYFILFHFSYNLSYWLAFRDWHGKETQRGSGPIS